MPVAQPLDALTQPTRGGPERSGGRAFTVWFVSTLGYHLTAAVLPSAAMTRDNPDTISMGDETSHWEATQVEDVFLPTVRVQLSWRDVEDAVANGAIVPAEAHSLWATWAMPGAPTRVVSAPAYPPSGMPMQMPIDLHDSGFASTRQRGDSLFREMPAVPAHGQGGRALAGGLGAALGLLAGVGLTWLLLG